MNKRFYKISRIAKKDTTIGHFLKLLYSIFSNELITGFLTLFITTIWIPLCILDIQKISFKELYFRLYIPLLVLVIIQFFSYISIQYKTRYIENFKAAKRSLRTVTGITTSWADRIDKMLIEIQSTPNIQHLVKEYKKHTKFKDRSSYLCKMLYEIIETVYDIDDHQVSILHKANSSYGDYIKMIAFENKDHEPPISFSNKFYFSNIHSKKYYHVQQFINKKRGIRIITNNKEIKKNFCIPETKHSREYYLEQYIAIPIIDVDKDFISLIQIDTKTKNIFGNNDEEVRYFAEEFIKPIAYFLKPWFKKEEFSKIIEEIV